jgi:hypothetical protein
LVHLIPNPLSDDEWREAQALYPNLPDQARRPLEDRVALSAHFIKTRQSSGPAETRRKLAHLRELADELSRELAEAAADDDTMMAIVSVGASDPSRGSTPRSDALSLLGQRQEQVSSLSRWMQAAADGLEAVKRGPNPDAENLKWLVQQCDYFLQHHGAGQITRTYKDENPKRFVTLIANASARAAGREPFGPGSIDEAMKRVIETRGGNNLKTGA